LKVGARRLVAMLWRRRPAPQASPPLPGAYRLPPRNPHFTGRDGHLDGIRAGLTAGRPVTIAALSGLGGVGKTELAAEYAYRFGDDYDIVWWVDAERPTLVPDQLGQLAEALGLASPDDLRQRHRWLLVFDNAERVADITDNLPGGTGHVLVTSRTVGWGALGGVVDIDVLPRPDSVALLCRRVPGLALETAAGIAESLGDLPLALDVAGAFLGRTGLPPEDYLKTLRESAEAPLSRGRVAGHQHTVATVLAISSTTIADEHPAAAALLRLCAFLGPEPIPLDLFTRDPSALPAFLAQADLAEAVGVLAAYSLVSYRPEGLVVHRLVQAATRHDLDPVTRTATAEAAVDLLRTDLPAPGSGSPHDWPRWRQLLPHVLAAVTHVQTGPGLVQLLSRAGVYLRLHGPRGAALPLLRRALFVDEARYGPDHVEAARRRQELAVVLYEVDEPAAARDLLERSLAIHRAALGDDHPVVASTLNMLGLTLTALSETPPKGVR